MLNRNKTDRGDEKESGEEDNTYVVESLIDMRKMKGKEEFKVKWLNYPEDQCTWEPASNLQNVLHLVEQMRSKKAKKSKKQEPESLSKHRLKKEYRESETKKNKKKYMNASMVRKHKNSFEHKHFEVSEEEEAKSSDEQYISDHKNAWRHNKATSSREKIDYDSKNDEDGIYSLEKPRKKIHKEIQNTSTNTDLCDYETEISKFGHFRFGDKPSKIVATENMEPFPLYTIEWKERVGGIKPLNTPMTSFDVRLYAKDFLLDYYEALLNQSKAEKSV